MNIRVFIFSLSLFFPTVSEADIYIITHRNTAVESISRQQLAAIYLLKKNYWDADDSTIIPLNLPAQSIIRKRFTQVIFNRSPQMLGDYWNKMSFKGVNPPLTQSSEQAALLFIKRVPGAISYVSQRPDDTLVKILLSIETK